MPNSFAGYERERMLDNFVVIIFKKKKTTASVVGSNLTPAGWYSNSTVLRNGQVCFEPAGVVDRVLWTVVVTVAPQSPFGNHRHRAPTVLLSVIQRRLPRIPQQHRVQHVRCREENKGRRLR